MRILPPQTRLPRKPTERRHRPSPSRRWASYRGCLRWDFGFTCPFCLLHESDLYGGQPGEGIGGTTVEHHFPRSSDPDLSSEYGNCLYACRLCNRSRANHPVVSQGARLLDPTKVAWAAHFHLEGDLLQFVTDDDDARYTHWVYDLNDPRKVARRRVRRELVQDRLGLLCQLGNELTELLELAELWRKADRARFEQSLRSIAKARQEGLRLLEDLKRFPAVPADAPRGCRCRSSENHSLPSEIEEQVLDLFVAVPHPLHPRGLTAPPPIL